MHPIELCGYPLWSMNVHLVVIQRRRDKENSSFPHVADVPPLEHSFTYILGLQNAH